MLNTNLKRQHQQMKQPILPKNKIKSRANVYKNTTTGYGNKYWYIVFAVFRMFIFGFGLFLRNFFIARGV